MKGSLGFFTGCFLYAVTGYALSRTGGVYHFEMIVLWALCFSLFSYFGSRADGGWKKPVEALIFLCLLAFLGRLYLRPLGWRSAPSHATAYILGPTRFTVFASLLFMMIHWIPLKNADAIRERALDVLIFGIALSHFLIQILVVRHSADPQIDVYSNTQLAAQYLWEFKNPYSQTYPDIYSGQMPYPSGFFYLPGVLMWVAPFYRIFGDVRFGLAAANLFLWAALWALLKRLALPPKSRRLWLLLWISFPVHAQLVECGYNESILCLFLTGAILLLEKGRWYSSGLLFGASLAVKQYLLPFVALSSLLPLKYRSIRFFTGLILAVCVILLPFYFWNPAAFIFSTVTALTHQPLRSDSFSFPALISQRFHYLMPSPLILSTSLLSLIFVLFKIYSKRWHAPQSIVFLYGMIFFFGKQAFINYYVLFAFSLYLFLVYDLSGKAEWAPEKLTKNSVSA